MERPESFTISNGPNLTFADISNQIYIRTSTTSPSLLDLFPLSEARVSFLEIFCRRRRERLYERKW